MPEQQQLSEDESNINTISELPTPPFKITMEIPLFLLMLGLSLSGAVINNLLLYRTCVHSLHFSKEQCNLLHAPGERSNETKFIEEEAQKYTTVVTMIRSIIEAVFPAMLSLFLGVWSDTHGRKPLLVWPLFGISMTSICVVIYALWTSLGPWWYILTAIPVSLCGGLTAVFTGSFSYISDISSRENRSLRLALLEAAIFIGQIVGLLLSSYLLRVMGDLLVLLLHSTVFVVAYTFTNLYVQESLRGALRGGLNTVLDLLLVKEMINTCFKRRPNNLRSRILLIIISNALSIFIIFGVLNLDYMYTRQKLQWDLKQYTIYSAASTSVMVLGLVFGVIMLQKLCRLSDLTVSILSYLSNIAEVVTKAFAVESWHMYLGATVGVYRGLSGPLTRSFITKIIPMEEIAQVFALGCALEAILPVFAPLIFSGLYAATLSTFPGAIYVLSAFVYTICLVFIVVCQYYTWKHRETTPYVALST